LAFRRGSRGSQQVIQSRGIDEARAHRVHANAAILQVHGPCPRERTQGGFRCAIDAPLWEPLLATMDAFRMIEVPSCSSGSHFCTVKSRPFTLLLKIAS